MVDLNKIGAGIAAGAAAGLAAGFGARIAMRVVALVAGLTPEFTLGGTLAILVFGVVLGMPFGGLFGVARRWLPGSGLWRGLVYGLALSLVFVVPPFLLAEPEGELALVSPLVGLSLFVPLPLLYGLLLGATAAWLDGRQAPGPSRQIGALWLALFSAALLLALTGLAGLPAAFRSPVAISLAIQVVGIPFRLLRQASLALLLFFAGAYCGLVVYIFWRGAESRPAKLTALALLLFAGAFFRAGAASAAGMQALPVARLVPGLGQAAGLGSLFLFLCLFPDGRFTVPWARRLAVAAGVWLVMVILVSTRSTPFNLANWAEELIVWSMTAVFLCGGVLALAHRYLREFAPEQRRRIRWVVWAATASVPAYAALWLIVMLIPDLGPRGGPGFAALVVFPPYLLPWLLIPSSLAFSMWRCRLWERETGDGGQWGGGQLGSTP